MSGLNTAAMYRVADVYLTRALADDTATLDQELEAELREITDDPTEATGYFAAIMSMVAAGTLGLLKASHAHHGPECSLGSDDAIRRRVLEIVNIGLNMGAVEMAREEGES